MKLRLILSLPLILASCGDLTPTDQDAPTELAPQKLAATAPSPRLVPVPVVAITAPAPATAPVVKTTATPTKTAPPTHTVDGPENPLGFLDPNTTGELLTEAKKKTVTGAASQLPKIPKVEGDSAIDVPPPTLPELKITE